MAEKTNLTIKLDKDVRNEFSCLCDEIGISMAAALNAFIKQSIRQQQFFFSLHSDPTLPVEQNPLRYNKETQAAIQETRDIQNGKVQAKVYHSAQDLFDELDQEMEEESC